MTREITPTFAEPSLAEAIQCLRILQMAWNNTHSRRESNTFESFEVVLRAVAASGSPPSPQKSCRWTQQDEDMGGQFATECGKLWMFTTDGIKENGAKFCPYCGGSITERASSGSTGAPILDQPTPLVPLDGFMGDEQHFRLEKSKVTAHTERDERVYLDPWPNGSVHLFTDELLALAHTLARSGPLDQPGAGSTGGAPTHFQQDTWSLIGSACMAAVKIEQMYVAGKRTLEQFHAEIDAIASDYANRIAAASRVPSDDTLHGADDARSYKP